MNATVGDRSGSTQRPVTPSGLTGAARPDGSAYAFGGAGAGASSTYSFPDRKASTGPTMAGRGTGGAAGSAGAWQAPDSWAVKPEGAASFDGDTDDEEGTEDEDNDDDAEEDLLDENGFDSDESGLGTTRNGSLGEVPRNFGSLGDGEPERLHSRAGHPSTSGGRPSTRSGRPGTADGEGRKGSQKPVSMPPKLGLRSNAGLLSQSAPLYSS